MNVQRVFHARTPHPRTHFTLTAKEFRQMEKSHIQKAPGLGPGHQATDVWFTKQEVRAYIVQINFERGEPLFYLVPCSIEPVFGIDTFDGFLIQDAEAWGLVQRLRCTTDRFDIFAEHDDVDTKLYLQSRDPALHLE